MRFGKILWTAICYVVFAVCSIDAVVSIAVGGAVWIWDVLLALVFCPIPRYRAWKYRQVSKLFGRASDPRDEFRVVRAEDIPPVAEPALKEEPENAPEEIHKTTIPGAVFAAFHKDGSVIVPQVAAGLPMAYHYKDVGIYTPDRLDVDLTQVDLGLRVSFRFEPENPYDAKAVAVYVGTWKIGYMNRGRLRDMLVDWVESRNPFWACITGIDDDERKVKIFLAFYRAPRHSYYDDDDEDEDDDDDEWDF